MRTCMYCDATSLRIGPCQPIGPDCCNHDVTCQACGKISILSWNLTLAAQEHDADVASRALSLPFDQAPAPLDYQAFIAGKVISVPPRGMDDVPVLEAEGSREPNDEKHICPMPLDLITRAVVLWSNHGDTVLSPFMGIGSEGVVSLRQGRRFIGVELKATYFKQAVGYLDAEDRQASLLSEVSA